MRWYIDGYNVTKSDPATKHLSLEEQREALQARMRARGRELLGSSDFVIVWDGAGGAGNSKGAYGSKAEYTRMPTADDSIVNRVSASRDHVGVVSSDNGLIGRCKDVARSGITVKASSSLYESAKIAKNKRRGSGINPNIGIPDGANEINRELKKLWGLE